jgi:hypothetical protein
LLNQQGDPVLLSCEDCPADCLQNALLRYLGSPDFVVQLYGLACLAFGKEPLGSANASLGNSRTDIGGGRGQRLLQSLGSLKISDPSQCHGCGRRNFGIVMPYLPSQQFDSVRVSANPDRVHRANQQATVQLTHGITEGLIGCGIGDCFKRYPCPRGKLRIVQEFLQVWNRIGGTIDSQFFAGNRLDLWRGIGLENVNQLGLPVITGIRWFFRVDGQAKLRPDGEQPNNVNCRRMQSDHFQFPVARTNRTGRRF